MKAKTIKELIEEYAYEDNHSVKFDGDGKDLFISVKQLEMFMDNLVHKATYNDNRWQMKPNFEKAVRSTCQAILDKINKTNGVR